MSILTYSCELRRWYASTLLFDVDEPNYEKVSELLDWPEHLSNHHLDWLKFRSSTKQGKIPSISTLRAYKNICAREANRVLNLPDRITLMMKRLIYSVFERNGYEELYNKTLGLLDYQIDSRSDNRELLVYSVLDETYVPLTELRSELSNIHETNFTEEIMKRFMKVL